MTHRAAGSGGGIPRIWLLPIVVATALLGVTAWGVLSRSLVLDLIAWWPVWLLLAILVVLARGRRIGKVRASGLMPLVVTATLIVFVFGHLAGWAVMPSASQTLVGPPAEPGTSAALSARIDGDVHLSSGGDTLYLVGPVRRGGDVGIPDASEQAQGEVVSVTLEPPADPGFYAFSGWDVLLSAAVPWSLTLEGDVLADLAGLDITALQLLGGGSVTLTSVPASTPATVSGSYELVVPAGVSARIVGEATVPDTWDQLTDGWRSPTPGDGWVIAPTTGSTLTVIDG